MIVIGLLFSAAARAQGPIGRETIGAGLYAPWQVSIGAQYTHENLIGVPFDTYGGNISLVRFFGRWVGVEGQFGAGFGNTYSGSNPPNLDARSLFGGGGLRLAYRSQSRFEPWVHFIVGAERFSFHQSSQSQGNMTALAGLAGGGVDLYLWRHVAIRTEAEPVASRFFAANQRSFQAIAGVVFDF